MKRWRYLCAGLTLLLLSACAAQQPGSGPRKGAPSTIEVTALPCAETGAAEDLRISYPGLSLYRSGAALPTGEGLTCLDALSGWLKAVSGAPLLITVSGEEGHPFNGLSLAAKRQELLQRYFERQGLDPGAWQWATESGSGFQLQITEIKTP